MKISERLIITCTYVGYFRDCIYSLAVFYSSFPAGVDTNPNLYSQSISAAAELSFLVEHLRPSHNSTFSTSLENLRAKPGAEPCKACSYQAVAVGSFERKIPACLCVPHPDVNRAGI